ncbi:hypothetical protein niasHT_018969 [Heterodera trifolii]|uniref:Uncharacterized protein n=1 Tax=Heterodera trifolii TaxID=157864 RepID=A0ABD2LDU0_9BILA
MDNIKQNLRTKSARKRHWDKTKREERKAQTAKAIKARLAKKTAAQPDPDAEMPQPSGEEPSTSEAPARDNEGRPPSTPTPMTPQEINVPNDLLITLDAGISFKARETLKRSYAGQGHDVWAPTWAVKSLKRELAEAANFEWMGEGQTRALVCTDVRAMVEGRLHALAESGRLQLHQQFVSQIVLVLTGDKGGDGVAATTKLGLVIGNVANPNSLEICPSLMGHQGAAASFPCPFCTARRKELSDKIVAARPSPPPPEYSYIWPPLVNIALKDVVPPSFHLLHGNGQRIIDAICAEADVRGKGDDMRRRLSDAGVRRHPRTKQFTGGDIYKILDHQNCASFTAPIPPGPLQFLLIDAMDDLRHIYHLSRARILHPEDLNSLERWTKLFYAHWQQLRSIDAARYPVRPKLHLLTAHVVPFARSHLWWGLISEQGMEHMHRMCNNATMLNALHDRGVEDNKENDKYPDF